MAEAAGEQFEQNRILVHFPHSPTFPHCFLMIFSTILPLAIPFLVSSCCLGQQKNETSIGERKDSESVSPTEVDVDALLDAVGMPSCIEHCIGSLRPEFRQILLLNNTFDRFQQICKDFHSARKCIHNGACLSMNKNLFDTVASGLQSLCEDKKQQFITKNEKCLRQTLDATSQRCEQKCHLIQELAEFSHRSDLKGLGIVHLLELLENLSDVCSASQCHLPCYRDGLNSACQRAGGVMLDGLLRPFYHLANWIQKGGPGLRRIVNEKVPKSCHFLTEKESLDKLVNPNKF